MNWTRFLYPTVAASMRRRIATLPDHKQIIMPKVSPTMTAGRLIVWKKTEGQSFAEGEDIADVESDKATMPISAREDGYMAKIFTPDDTPDIPLGQLLAITVEEEEHISAFTNYQPPEIHPSSTTPPPHDSPKPHPTNEYTGPLGPAVTRLLNQFPQIDLNAITPTGPKGRILKGDVLAAIENDTAFNQPSTIPQSSTSTPPPPPPPPPQDIQSKHYTDVPVSSMRRAIARRLLESKTTVPHRYAASTYQLDALLALRKRLNAVDPSPKISVNDFIIRAVGIALRRVPEMNFSWNDVSKQAVQNASIDVSMAVAIPGGLITPIVTDVDRRGLVEIAAMTKDLVLRAREGALAPEEFEGGSFSISNLGMFGVPSFSAIINPPHSGILAVGSGVERAVMSDEGKMYVVTEGMATLSTDARVVEEESAAAFLKEFSSCLTNPENMLA